MAIPLSNLPPSTPSTPSTSLSGSGLPANPNPTSSGITNTPDGMSSADPQSQGSNKTCWQSCLSYLKRIPCLGRCISWFINQFGGSSSQRLGLQPNIASSLLPIEQQDEVVKNKILAAILSTTNPQEQMIVTALALFNSIQDILPKLGVIHALQVSASCSPAILLRFIDSLPTDRKSALHVQIHLAQGADSSARPLSGSDLVANNSKSDVAKAGLTAYIKVVQTEIDNKKMGVILNNFQPNLPNSTQYSMSHALFRSINNDKIKLQTLAGLLNVVNLSGTNLQNFITSLPEHLSTGLAHQVSTQLQLDYQSRLTQRLVDDNLVAAEVLLGATPPLERPAPIAAPVSGQAFLATNPQDALVKAALAQLIAVTN